MRCKHTRKEEPPCAHHVCITVCLPRWDHLNITASLPSFLADSPNRKGSVRLALRHALVPSFGSIAFAAAILTLLRMMRRSLERASRQNIICCIINCIAQPILALIEQFSKFATVTTAITGQSFVEAAKSTFALLKRNFLRTYSGKHTVVSFKPCFAVLCCAVLVTR